VEKVVKEVLARLSSVDILINNVGGSSALGVVYFKLQLGSTPVEKRCASKSNTFYIEVNQLIH
jgi:hypothetical protein